MPLSQQDKRRFKTIGHHLKPVLIFGGQGLTESFVEELNRRLEDHELIKVRVNAETRDDRSAVVEALCETSGAELVQRIGNIALLYRAAKKPSPKLSNILRAQQG
ncbi:ribosome assembly RNA-binding protein YhbY [Isoalcanivorax indicus]|uniref:ribosome assembly RNA-binding protein YhbY n=1 Tax=Isoalcanivorax indicus TaxID=2202653 RepID=UPI000DB9B083|nr:ribosome assembly RNA-binding protein YhbY [Isoalcanivorax indicus]